MQCNCYMKEGFNLQNRIAILGDVHGNVTALEAVLKDCIANDVTEYWFLGDLILPGPGGHNLFEMLERVKPTVWLNGNWEESYLQFLNGQVDINDPADIHFAKIAERLARDLKESDVVRMKQAPIHQIKQVNHLNFSITHNLPNKSYGPELYPTQDQSNFDQLFKEHEELDVAVYAHIHQPVLRYTSKGQLILNPGAVGQPYDSWPKLWSDLRAQYAIITVDDEGLQVNFRKVSYNVDRELQRANAVNLPYLSLYEELRKTGKAHTHNQDMLAQMNEEFGYKQDVINYLKNKS